MRDSIVELLYSLGATVATFAHSRDELENVIKAAAQQVESWNARSQIVMEARRCGTTKSDLLVLASHIDDKLEESRIDVFRTPRHIDDYQIDEAEFEKVLDGEVSYLNPRAKERDINSVRSIYVLREDTSPSILERAKAALVTSNAGFSQAAFQYGQKYEASREVSSVITDFSLANMAWLKAPLGAPEVPMAELLAVSYAALEPSAPLFEKYLSEIDRLKQQGKITERDHQLLRSSYLVTEELMNLTLGEEEALTEQTVTETLKRVTEEIRKEESDKYRNEREAHRRTEEVLAERRTSLEYVQKHLYWRCQKQATVCAWCVSIGISVLLVVSLAAAVIDLRSNNAIAAGIDVASSAVLFVLTLASLIFGTSVKRLHKKMQACCLAWCVRRKAAETGLDLSESQ